MVATTSPRVRMTHELGTMRAPSNEAEGAGSGSLVSLTAAWSRRRGTRQAEQGPA
jgi:hypothetical protein